MNECGISVVVFIINTRLLSGLFGSLGSLCSFLGLYMQCVWWAVVMYVLMWIDDGEWCVLIMIE